MAPRILSYLIFTVLMTVIVAGSLLVVVLLYLPFVALKAIYTTATGKVRPRLAPAPPHHQSTADS
jgi:uncharacterized membrane protein